MKKIIIGLGPVRSGTTWLYDILKEQKFIKQPKYVKELNLLDKEGFIYNEYIKQFEDYGEIFLDISPNYLGKETVYKNAEENFDEVYYIVNLREPRSRITSMLRYKAMFGAEDPMCELLASDWLRYLRLYPLLDELMKYNRKVLFLNFQDIKNNPEAIISHLELFLSNKIHYTSKINEESHASLIIRNGNIGKLAFFVQHLLRHRLKLRRVADFTKNNKFLRRIISAKDEQLDFSKMLDDDVLSQAKKDYELVIERFLKSS